MVIFCRGGWSSFVRGFLRVERNKVNVRCRDQASITKSKNRKKNCAVHAERLGVQKSMVFVWVCKEGWRIRNNARGGSFSCAIQFIGRLTALLDSCYVNEQILTHILTFIRENIYTNFRESKENRKTLCPYFFLFFFCPLYTQYHQAISFNLYAYI